MPVGISEKRFLTGVAVHISREPNMAVKETRPTKRFINTSGRPNHRQTVEHLHRTPVNFNALLLIKTLISTEEMEYSTPIKIPARMITLTKRFRTAFHIVYVHRDGFRAPAAINIQVVMPRNAQLKCGIIASTVIGSAGCTPPISAAPASRM